MAEKSIEEILQFFKESGFDVTPKGAGYHVRFTHPSLPGKSFDDDASTEQLRNLYNTIRSSYADFNQKRRGEQN